MAFFFLRAKGGGASSLTTAIINGQPTVVFGDTTRLEGSPATAKLLSIAEQPIMFSENKLGDQDWIAIGDAIDADSGYIADFDATIVYASAHCEDTGANSKDIHLYVDGVDNGSIGTLSGGANATFINNTIDVDLDQGDRIRLRAEGATGAIQDTVAKLTLKWRAS